MHTGSRQCSRTLVFNTRHHREQTSGSIHQPVSRTFPNVGQPCVPFVLVVGASRPNAIHYSARVTMGRNRLWPNRLWPKPTLAKPTLAKVKVFVVCKDFWFWGVNCLGFFEINCSGFLCVCVELSSVVPDQVWGGRGEGGLSSGVSSNEWCGLEGWRRVGPQGWGPKPRRREETDFGQSRFGHPDLTNFGQSIFGHRGFGPANQFWPKPILANPILANPLLAIWIWVGVMVPKGGATKGGATKGGAAEGGATKGGEPKISSFFPCPAAKFVLFFPLWGSSRGFLVVFGSAGAVKCSRLEFSGCRVKPRRPRSRRGFTRQPESPNLHI